MSAASPAQIDDPAARRPIAQLEQTRHPWLDHMSTQFRENYSRRNGTKMRPVDVGPSRKMFTTGRVIVLVVATGLVPAIPFLLRYYAKNPVESLTGRQKADRAYAQRTGKTTVQTRKLSEAVGDFIENIAKSPQLAVLGAKLVAGRAVTAVIDLPVRAAETLGFKTPPAHLQNPAEQMAAQRKAARQAARVDAARARTQDRIPLFDAGRAEQLVHGVLVQRDTASAQNRPELAQDGLTALARISASYPSEQAAEAVLGANFTAIGRAIGGAHLNNAQQRLAAAVVLHADAIANTPQAQRVRTLSERGVVTAAVLRTSLADAGVPETAHPLRTRALVDGGVITEGMQASLHAAREAYPAVDSQAVAQSVYTAVHDYNSPAQVAARGPQQVRQPSGVTL